MMEISVTFQDTAGLYLHCSGEERVGRREEGREDAGNGAEKVKEVLKNYSISEIFHCIGREMSRNKNNFNLLLLPPSLMHSLEVIAEAFLYSFFSETMKNNYANLYFRYLQHTALLTLCLKLLSQHGETFPQSLCGRLVWKM